MTKQEMLISLMRSNARGERGKSRGSKTKRDRLVHAQCAEVWEDAAELVHEFLIPKLPKPAVVFNKRPTADNYLSLAEKFDEARWGNGPGIGEAELAEIGLKGPEHTGWENTCRYVWEQFKTRYSVSFESGGGCIRSGFQSRKDAYDWIKLDAPALNNRDLKGYMIEKEDEPWPGSQCRGRGFHSQECGKHIVKLLKELAEDWRRNASPLEQLAECATNKEAV